MRWVDRAAVPVPISLDGPTSLAAREYARAAQHFRSNMPAAFNFTAYRQQDVADALNDLFRGKCAYCESSIKAVQPTDIEHFRPKGRVAECPQHPGYWWLAAKWENLLPSCIDCNRRRYQNLQQINYDLLDEEVDGRFYLGKGDLFPILGARHALTEAENYDAEDAALINPTHRHPGPHLVWLQEQGLSLVGPSVSNGVIDPYGRHTYRVFGLNRQGLVELRTARMREIQAQVVFVEKLLDQTIVMPEPFSSDLLNTAFEQFLSLYKYAESDQPFSAMVENLLEVESLRLAEKYQMLI